VVNEGLLVALDPCDTTVSEIVHQSVLTLVVQLLDLLLLPGSGIENVTVVVLASASGLVIAAEGSAH